MSDGSAIYNGTVNKMPIHEEELINSTLTLSSIKALWFCSRVAIVRAVITDGFLLA